MSSNLLRQIFSVISVREPGLRAGKRSLIRISDFTAFFGWESASLAQSNKAFSNGFEDKFFGEVPSASTSFLCAVYLESLANDGGGCAKISSILVDPRVKLTNQPGHVGHSATRRRRRTGGGCERRECETEERIRSGGEQRADMEQGADLVTPFTGLPQDTIFSNQPPVCIGGIVYLLTNRNTFLAFDSKTETHREFPSPIAAIEDNKNYSKGRIVDYKGKLGFTCEYKSDEVWLWGVEDNRDYRWEIKRVVRIDKENNRLIGCSLADMALMIGYSYQVSGSHYYKDIFPFRSDWEPVDLEDGCMLSGLEELITAISSDDD
nr:F-box protein At5g49610-like [Ipomoea trifida]